MIETAAQWDDEWWRIWEDARAHGGEAAARHADLEMSERHGLRPAEPPLGASAAIAKIGELGRAAIVEIGELAGASGGVAPAGRLVCNGPDVAESVLRLARGVNLELDPWQVDAIRRLYGVHIGGRRNGRTSARALVAEIHSRAQASPPAIIDELPYFVAAEREPRRGWLGRLLDRMFG
jgi:hypothetical protein